MRYLIYFLIAQVFNTLAWFVAPVLPLFATMQDGPADNSNKRAVEPRLPWWLSWFMTPDNSLWGDHGWQTIHCPEYESYWGMVKWLCRNRAYGFNWSVLAALVDLSPDFIVSGNLNIDRNNGKFGSFSIQMDSYWQRKWVMKIGSTGYLFSMNMGWLLDPYVKNKDTILSQPLALFLFSPRFGRVKPL